MAQLLQLNNVFQAKANKFKVQGTIGPFDKENHLSLTDESGSCTIFLKATKPRYTKLLTIGNKVKILNPEINLENQTLIIGEKTSIFCFGGSSETKPKTISSMDGWRSFESIKESPPSKVSFIVCQVVIMLFSTVVNISDDHRKIHLQSGEAFSYSDDQLSVLWTIRGYTHVCERFEWNKATSIHVQEQCW